MEQAAQRARAAATALTATTDSQRRDVLQKFKEQLLAQKVSCTDLLRHRHVIGPYSRRKR